MRDRTRSRTHSPERDEFRRGHEVRRAWGKFRRHTRRQRELLARGEGFAPVSLAGPDEVVTVVPAPPARPSLTAGQPSPRPASASAPAPIVRPPLPPAHSSALAAEPSPSPGRLSWPPAPLPPAPSVRAVVPSALTSVRPVRASVPTLPSSAPGQRPSSPAVAAPASAPAAHASALAAHASALAAPTSALAARSAPPPASAFAACRGAGRSAGQRRLGPGGCFSTGRFRPAVDGGLPDGPVASSGARAPMSARLGVARAGTPRSRSLLRRGPALLVASARTGGTHCFGADRRHSSLRRGRGGP